MLERNCSALILKVIFKMKCADFTPTGKRLLNLKINVLQRRLTVTVSVSIFNFSFTFS